MESVLAVMLKKYLPHVSSQRFTLSVILKVV